MLLTCLSCGARESVHGRGTLEAIHHHDGCRRAEAPSCACHPYCDEYCPAVRFAARLGREGERCGRCLAA